MSVLQLTGAVYQAIRAHGEEAWPRECCGALLGLSAPQVWRVEAAVRAGNARVDSAHNRYSIGGEELVAMVREARRRGLEIAGFYHSHPNQPAQWSALDLAEAHWQGCCYVITAVAEGKATVTHSYLLAGAGAESMHFEPQTILVEGEVPGPGCK